MRAAVLSEVGSDLDVRDDVVLHGPGPGEVRLRVRATGLCHSDLSVRSGVIPQPLPCIPGHEASGEVLAVGEGVDHVVPGDRVVVAWSPPCGGCADCPDGHPNLCVSVVGPAASVPHGTVAGADLYTFSGVGTFAEEAVVPAPAAVRVDPDTPFDVAALVGCAVVTGVGAVVNAARVRPASSVVVFGCGGVGLSAIQGAVITGAATVVGVDPVPARRDAALRFGASHATGPEGLADLRGELTGGRGFDYAVEAVGRSETIRAAWEAVRRGGTAVVVGVGRHDDLVSFSAFELFLAERRLVGSYYGSADVRSDFARLLRLWRTGRLDLEGMISQRIDLGEVNAGLAALADGSAIRSVVTFP